jgi:hypothetical protein
VDGPETLGALLARDPVQRPPPSIEAAWRAIAAAADAPGADPALAALGEVAALSCELRWWDARELAARGAWDALGALAEAGLGAPFSEREAVRLAFLHCASGSLGEAEHVIAQAVQLGSDERLPRRFAAWCEREGLHAAAARFC